MNVITFLLKSRMKKNHGASDGRKKRPAACNIFFSALFPLAVLISLSACAPVSVRPPEDRRPSVDQEEQSGISSEETDFTALLEENDPDDQCVSVESEQFLEDELAALEKIGPWQSPEEVAPPATPGAKKTPSAATSGFPLTINRHVSFYIKQFQTTQKRYFSRSMERSGRYLPMIRRELKAAGLPEELAYLAFVESGFMPTAYSRAGAMGLWQFMKPTGKKFGLRIDRWVDERRDPEKATRAAVRYLADLYERFGSWPLAVAGYNAGEGKIAAAIHKFRTRNFWKLANHRYLKLETKRYVPKLIAAILIAKNPKKYGFSNIRPAAPLRYDEQGVPAGVPLSDVAALCKTDVRHLRELNPELRTNYIPSNQGTYQLRLPKGTGKRLAANLAALHPRQEIAFKTHIVKKGENLTRICRLYNLDKISLLKANNLHTGRLRAGQRLRIPYRRSVGSGMLLTAKTRKRIPKTGGTATGKKLTHIVKKGETLSHIAWRYKISTREIMALNNLKSPRHIRAGQRLLLRDKGNVSTFQIPAGTREKSSRSTAGTTQKRQIYKVVAGDSLWSIAQGFGVSTADLRAWNDLKDDRLHPGMKLIVAGDRATGRSHSSPAKNRYYRVRSGDSIWTIARRFQVSTSDLRHWNNLKSNIIRPGTRLIIRGV